MKDTPQYNISNLVRKPKASKQYITGFLNLRLMIFSQELERMYDYGKTSKVER